MGLVLKSVNSPMPSNIYYWWNFGSLLGLCLVLQLLTGIFLSMFYDNSIFGSFSSLSQIERNINLGWMMRSFHANGASLFFIFIYLHIGRGLYFKSFNLLKVWFSGVIIFLLLFMVAFIGYVLPWGQMSFWGATVITNLLTSLPYAGNSMTLWLWGGYSVGSATLMRFFTFHFLFPFIMVFLVMLHLLFLHQKGSNNPLGVCGLDKLPFHPYFLWKDLIGVLFVMNMFIIVVFLSSYSLMDPDNFIPANPLVTPEHIQPEWYFLFAYAILRAVPNKLGGVLALVASIMILCILPFLYNVNFKKNNFLSLNKHKFIFFIWICNFFYLIMLGAMAIEEPFVESSQVCSIFYFIFYFIFV